jgi:hypothetical protein
VTRVEVHVQPNTGRKRLPKRNFALSDDSHLEPLADDVWIESIYCSDDGDEGGEEDEDGE